MQTVNKNNSQGLSTTLLTTETSLVLILDYQEHVMKDIKSTDLDLIKLNGKALARVSKAFDVPVILSTIGVKLRGDHPTIDSIRTELADQPEYDRTTMNAWEDEALREAVEKSGRKRLIFAGLWTEVCLLYPVLHAQRDGFETYFVADAVGGSNITAHETAIKRMIQAGSQPLTLNSLFTEWIRDWKTSPYGEVFGNYRTWYDPEIEKVEKNIITTSLKGNAFSQPVL